MAEEKSKLIPFSKELEKAVEADAVRCRRSFVRQVEAVLMTYYGIQDVEINKQSLEIIGELMPKSRTKTPVIEAVAENPKKKRTA